ncbi:uncharacterized protein LOC131630872 [Vicia villosa]|uniref:uncharacterized protein LOC131630872 n=1 Tax=Vicia villosa TaxID=3911 RepID=UPI00273AB822|nr:uncharacterized protein LOC131630872 [Vicia villosa]
MAGVVPTEMSANSPRRTAQFACNAQGGANTEMKTGILQLVYANPFTGMDHEDPFAHLTKFYEIAEKFLERYFPQSRFMEAKTTIAVFNQGSNESLNDAWERFKSMLRKCKGHGFDDLTQTHIFRNGLQPVHKTLLDATAGGSLMSKSTEDAIMIIDRMALNDLQTQHDRSPSQRKPGVLELNTNDAILAQNKLLSQQVELLTQQMMKLPQQMKEFQGSQTRHHVAACELCNGDHRTGFCPPPEGEEVNYVNNANQGYQSTPPPHNNHYQRHNQGYQPSRFKNYNYPQQSPYQSPNPQHQQSQGGSSNLEDTLTQFMQASMANQKSNEAAIKNLENQVGNLAKQLSEQQPGSSFSANTQTNPREHCKAIVTRSGKEINGGIDGGVIVEDDEEIIVENQEGEVVVEDEGEKSEEKVEEELVEKERKEKEGREKNDKKVKRNKKRNENKKKYTVEETVVLDAHCSAIIQKTPPRKEADPGRVILPITIGGNYISNGLVDLGSSINLIPLSVVKRLGNIEMKHTRITLQLADKSIISPYGVVQDMLVKVDKFLFPVDFVVVDMEEDCDVPLILGRPFMKTTRMMIDIDDGIMKVRVQDKEVIFTLFESTKPPKDEHDNFRIDDEKGEIIEVANQFHKDKEKANHEGKTHHKNFEVGQMVLVCNSRLKVFPSKLKSKWSGPFVVREVRNYGSIVVEDPKTQESWTVKEQRIKGYHDG